jgi:hypothetical protein
MRRDVSPGHSRTVINSGTHTVARPVHAIREPMAPWRGSRFQVRGEAVDTSMSLAIQLLSELRAALARQHEISSEVREDVAALAVHTSVRGAYVWVFVASDGRYFSWRGAQCQHPVKDVAGAARRVANEADSGDAAAVPPETSESDRR